MKKLHYFKKIKLGYLFLKTHFSKITLIVISILVITITGLDINAQPAIQGYVFDNVKREPITGVSIKIINEDTKVEVITRTNEKGYFYKALPPGYYLIQFTAS